MRAGLSSFSAGIASLVRRQLAKLESAGSIPATRSKPLMLGSRV